MMIFQTGQGIAVLFLMLLTALSRCAPNSHSHQARDFGCPDSSIYPLTLDEALLLATVQASVFQQAALNERSVVRM
jgi:hypothetical protein